MDLRTSSLNVGDLSPPDSLSDPEEKEVSDDDDDDRNHKHRRRDTLSQSSERDALDQVLTRPYSKRNKTFESGHFYRGNDSHQSETWKNYNTAPLEKDFSAKFEKRRTGLAAYPRASMELNQRIRANQSSSVSWSQRDSRLSSVDIASQMVQQGPVPPGLFAGRGLPNVSNAQSAPWSAFGMIPGIPNGGLDALHCLGLQATLRPTINPSMNVGIARQRCRDFEERGFCLRGDICPMEHGVNRIVVEDVQSLSQFNLPVSLPSAHLFGAPGVGLGPPSSVSAPSGTLINNNSLHSRSSKHGIANDVLALNGAFSSPANAAGADVYDPDEPLWANDRLETSTAPLSLNPSRIDESDNANAVGSQSTSLSVWGRISDSKNRSEMREKLDSTTSTSNYVENEVEEDQETLTNLQGAARPQVMDSSLKTQGGTGLNRRKLSQKAQRTLFVNGIPKNNNKREALLSHFRKFGEVIDIYIPLNSERAFVQFSKREEAEAALTAPDAVMGNRFIKLWWANRDSIQEDIVSAGNNVSLNPRGVVVASVPSHPSATNRGKDNNQSAAPKSGVCPASVVPLPTSDHPKPVATNSPKDQPPLKKKLESLEVLKEELRKKQEMLDQKRNDFRRQLNKLEKQATGHEGEVVPEQAAKRHKVGTLSDVAKAETPRPSGVGAVVVSPLAEVMTDKNTSGENVVHLSPKTNSSVVPQEPSSLKPSTRPLAPAGAPFIMNRFKLDNRPTAFRIIPPLPSALANVAVLKEHFSTFGALSNVELEDLEAKDSEASKNWSAHISFTTRRSAEKAFVNGKCWQGNNLQFMWLAPSNSRSERGVSQEAVASGSGESENIESKKSDEDLQSFSSGRSFEERSTKGEVC